MAPSFPQLETGKELAVGGGLGGQGRRLVAHVGLPEQDDPDAAVLDARIGLEQLLLGGDLADDDGISRIVLGEFACFVGGVNGLDDLLR